MWVVMKVLLPLNLKQNKLRLVVHFISGSLYSKHSTCMPWPCVDFVMFLCIYTCVSYILRMKCDLIRIDLVCCGS